MIRSSALVAITLWIALCARVVEAQDADAPSRAFDPAVMEAHIRFLASDELAGRKPGTPGSDIAARYIAEQFRAAGLEPVDGASDYLQEVSLALAHPTENARLTTGTHSFEMGRNLGMLSGAPIDGSFPLVSVGYGLNESDYEDVRGKIIVAQFGAPNSDWVSSILASWEKLAFAATNGAVALVEVQSNADLGEATLGMAGVARTVIHDIRLSTPHAVIFDTTGILERAAKSSAVGNLISSGVTVNPIASSNVAGFVRGRDPDLHQQWIILTAHYDGLGVRSADLPADSDTPADSIHNGARDNGIGTVALISTAHALAADPPRRSVLLLAFTAEEDGLLGARHYANRPLVPLGNTIFVLNADGVGATNSTLITLVGLERTSGTSLIQTAAEAVGLTVNAGVPEGDLYPFSDHFVFARKGIPSVMLSPGIDSFSNPIVSHYYHKPSDEVDRTFDFRYLQRYSRIFALAARQLADAPEAPTWMPGQPFEAAARALYGQP